MDPYYSTGNLLLYAAAIIVSGFGITFLVYLKEDHVSSRLFFVFLSLLIGFPALLVLARTCPYPRIQTALSIGKFISLSAVPALGFYLCSQRAKGRFGKNGRSLFRLSRSAAHRWIMESLSESCLITDPQGRILSCGKTVLSDLEPNYREELFSFLKRAFGDDVTSENSREGIPELLKTISILREGRGEIEVAGYFYKWVFCPLGDKEKSGHLLYLTDQTKEQKLLRRRREQGRLMEVKIDWLRKQGNAALNRKNIIRSEEILKSAALLIEENLTELGKDLRQLIRKDQLLSEDLESALGRSRQVMARIRETIHSLPYNEVKEKL